MYTRSLAIGTSSLGSLTHNTSDYFCLMDSSDTGGYSKARTRLPENVLKRLVGESGAALAKEMPREHLWCGHPVKVFDGSTVLMSETQANQIEYPQHGNQQKGCGFPIARIVVVFR